MAWSPSDTTIIDLAPVYTEINKKSPILGTNTTLFTLTADMNTTADQAFIPAFPFSRYVIDRIVVTGADVNLTNAVGGVYGATGKTTPVLIASDQKYSGLSTSAAVINPPIILAGQGVMTANPLYLSLTTAQGVPSSAQFFLMGIGGN